MVFFFFNITKHKIYDNVIIFILTRRYSDENTKILFLNSKGNEGCIGFTIMGVCFYIFEITIWGSKSSSITT